MKNVLHILFVISMVYAMGLHGQEQVIEELYLPTNSFEPAPRKGSFYINWGYNRDHYQNTDIHFKGDDFDFTLKDVSAHDVPEKFDPSIYFNLTKLTIPQFNFRFGYFIRDNVSISGGWDHMKYRITEYQQLLIDGYINEARSTLYGGEYDDESIILTPGFVRFEHTDGMNFLRFSIERYNHLYHIRNSKFRFESMISASVGLATPWTDFTFIGQRYKNWLHVAGWGASAIIGVRAHYGDHLYLQYRTQIGYLNMTDILLEDEANSRASHDIKFTELAVSLGYNFGLRKRHSH